MHSDRGAQVDADDSCFRKTKRRERAVDDADMQEIELGQIDRPALIIVGDQDHFVSPKIPDRLADTIPGSRLVRLPGVGRLVPEEAPDTVANMILEFVGAASMARTE
jgi:pimeloyl-ACP methyl ester carboxylesterase